MGGINIDKKAFHVLSMVFNKLSVESLRLERPDFACRIVEYRIHIDMDNVDADKLEEIGKKIVEICNAIQGRYHISYMLPEKSLSIVIYFEKEE